MQYIIQATLYTALFYGVYVLALKDKASHGFSRGYLLFCAIVPLFLPLIVVPVTGSPAIANGIEQLQLPEFRLTGSGMASSGSLLTFGNIYLVIALLIFARLLFQLGSFYRFTRAHKTTKHGDATLMTGTNAGPGSFLNYIFLPGNNANAEIYAHELAHVKLKHSADLLLMKILQACLWPNVLLYVLLKELKLVHEFQADEAASTTGREQYVAALLNDTFHTNRFAVTHTFFFHPLKRRIMMLQRSPMSHRTKRLTALKTLVLAALPLCTIVYLQSCKPQPAADMKSQPGMKVMYDTIHENKSNVALVNTADVMPVPDFDLIKYFIANTKYPDIARAQKVEYKVIVKFIVNEDGHISEAEPRNMSDSLLKIDAYKALANEAVRVVAAMPAWRPAEKGGKKVRIITYQPVSFRLQ